MTDGPNDKSVLSYEERVPVEIKPRAIAGIIFGGAVGSLGLLMMVAGIAKIVSIGHSVHRKVYPEDIDQAIFPTLIGLVCVAFAIRWIFVAIKRNK